MATVEAYITWERFSVKKWAEFDLQDHVRRIMEMNWIS
jgi:hypothetical protein